MTYEAFVPQEWERKFVWESKEVRLDGGGQLGAVVKGYASPDGMDWYIDKNYNPMLPCGELEAALLLATSAASGTAVKALLVEHRASPASPVQGDSDEAMETRQNNNRFAAHVNEGLDALLVDLSIVLPYEFTL